jgi:16S rRNA processing protein RimM
LQNFSDWQIYLKDEAKSKLVQVEQFKTHNDHYVAKLVNIEDRDAAASFTNWHIAIKRELLPELSVGEYYLADLLGMAVYNKDGSNLGEVVDFLSTGANEVLIVRKENKEHLIPCVFGRYVLGVCLDKREMQVAWDEEF